MAAAPYLIALALLEQGGQRAMPLQGKSLLEPVPADGDPGDVGRQQALELLVRVWQRSEEGALRRAAGEHSLLLLELPIEALQETLPALKAQWIATGDSTVFLQRLRELAGGLWILGLERREPLCFRRLQ
ncbi:hypothetical protein [Synechococcus sp. RedBA-s]|uniref:hypothetical protein n=1 Tax=Synechococcus sp. RedBA-s TaxID=2823741 RepID=UPI0020CC5885|nr:hypothetical protein [Synechococcus sp. RedBA-s]MCP9799575.1 hypothetical protein [Synechococcus sp. RedBA-s]